MAIMGVVVILLILLIPNAKTSENYFDLLLNMSKQHFYPNKETYIVKNLKGTQYPYFNQLCNVISQNWPVVVINLNETNGTETIIDHRRVVNTLVVVVDDKPEINFFFSLKTKYLFYIDLREDFSTCSRKEYLNIINIYYFWTDYFQSIFLFHYQKNCPSEYEIWTRAPWSTDPGQRIENIKNAYFNKKPNFQGKLLSFFSTVHEIFTRQEEKSSLEAFKIILFEKWNMVDRSTIKKTFNNTKYSIIFIEPAGSTFDAYGVMSLCFVVQKGKEHPKSEAVVWCFHWKVWLWLTIVWIFSGLTWYFINKQSSLVQSLSEMFSLIVTEGVNWLPRINTSLRRFVAGLLMLMSIVIITGFQSNLYKNMQLPILYPPISEIRQIKDENLTIICTYPLSCFDLFGVDLIRKEFNKEGNKLFQEMSRQFIYEGMDKPYNHTLVYKSTYTLNDVMTNPNMALITSCETARLIINTIPSLAKKLHVVEETIVTYPLAFTSFPFEDKMRHLLALYYESGIGQWKEFQIQWEKLLRILLKEKKEPLVRVFTMDDVQVAFIILFIGLSISTFVFLLECLSKYLTLDLKLWKKLKSQRQSRIIC